MELPNPWTCPRCGLERNELAGCDRCDLSLGEANTPEEEEEFHLFCYKDISFSVLTTEELREMKEELLSFPPDSAVVVSVAAMRSILERLITREEMP